MKIVCWIATYSLRDLVRSRWLIAYAAFFLIATSALLRFSDSDTKALLSLVNVVLLVVPLANIVFGAMYLYTSREFVELLLAQPIRRGQLYGGLYLGLTIPVSLAAVLGIAAPLVVQGADVNTMRIGFTIAIASAVLSAVFTAIAAVVAYAVEDRVRGLALAIGLWLTLAVLYDAGILMAAVHFAHYPLERVILGGMIANPIDLVRLMLLREFDIAALLGYTGAVFQKFFDGSTGALVATGAVALWVALPVLAGARLFHRKDF